MIRRSLRIACAALLLAGVVTPAGAEASAEPFAQSGIVRSRLSHSRRHLAIDSTARLLFDIGEPLPPQTGMLVDLYDLDSLRRIRSVAIPRAQSGAGGMLSTVDELRHRLYVVYPVRAGDAAGIPSLPAAVTDGEAGRLIFEIAAIDTLRGALIGTGSLALMVPAVPHDRGTSNETGVKALTYFRDGNRDLLYLASEIPTAAGDYSVSTHAVFLHQIDVSKLMSGAASAVDWSYPVAQCGKLMSRETTGIVLRSAQSPSVAIPCRQGGAQGVSGQPLETPGVVIVNVSDAGSPADVRSFTSEFFAISGNLGSGVAAVDAQAERILVQVEGSTTESGVWVFDVGRASWIGLVVLPQVYALGGLYGLAVDASYGRAYAISKLDPDSFRSTIVATSTRGSTADQGTVGAFRPATAPNKARIVSDPVRHRLFVGSLEGYLVVQDNLPAPDPIRAANPDALTADVAEGPNTQANFLGSAQAYGARIRWVGGLRGVDRNANTYAEIPSELRPNTGGITPPPPSEGTRDLHLARIFHTTVANAEASSRATGAQRDLDNTDADASGLTTYVRRWGGPDLSAQRWPYPTIDCTDFGGTDEKRTANGYGATVSCNQPAYKATAVAVDESLWQANVLRIAEARSRTAVGRDARRGVVSIVEAEAFGVDLGGAAGIGHILVRAETWATGRPRGSNRVGAGSRFTRTFEDVWIKRADGTRVTVCGEVCEPKAVAEAINRALGLRARVDVPDPEPSRAAGTPGGFEALVVRDPLERANESSVNDESDDRRMEVPGLVVTVFADGRVPSRVVISLAGVAAESHYGIFLVQQAGPFRPIGGYEARGPAPSFGGTPGTIDLPPFQSGGASFTRRLADGVRFALASPGRAVRVFAMLALLAAPLILLMRRRSYREPG